MDNTAELNIWSTTRNIAGQYSFSGSPDFYDFSGRSSCTNPLDVTTCGSFRLGMEVICILFIVGFTVDEFCEFCREWRSRGRFLAYYDDGMNYFESASVFLFWLQLATWLVLLYNPEVQASAQLVKEGVYSNDISFFNQYVLYTVYRVCNSLNIILFTFRLIRREYNVVYLPQEGRPPQARLP